MVPAGQSWGGIVTRGRFNWLADEVSHTRLPPQRGAVRTTRGTTFRIQRQPMRGWLGYALLAGVPFCVSGWESSCPFANPETLTDNSAGTWEWLVFNLTTGLVTLESGPAPSPCPNDQEWMYVAHIVGVPHVTRFG